MLPTLEVTLAFLKGTLALHKVTPASLGITLASRKTTLASLTTCDNPAHRRFQCSLPGRALWCARGARRGDARVVGERTSFPIAPVARP